jgi:hypothetical protein
MLARTITWCAGAMLVAASALAQADGAQNKRPIAKAAHVPSRPALPEGVTPQVAHEVEPARRQWDHVPAPPMPAQQVTDLTRALAGTYRCRGSVMNLHDGRLRPSRATMRIGGELDGYWIGWTIEEQQSDVAPFPLRVHLARTYVAGARTWTSVMMDNRGRLEVLSSDHGADASITWRGMSSVDGGAVRVRLHEDRDDAAGVIRMWREVSADGATYVKQLDLTCRR